ncbi:GntR family transcriptional regulator [Mycobacterium colombiense]|uniref:FadR/GntR family transcriptional regulator n=1 Tax=Mycobacterium colombiense TaxID=339268 RepID=UPI0007F00A9F|nr:FCD domain-containing protein [Mycobacterium colombiense]OBK68932.1 GntR family transcriptional regulator [Mycobacterium colombiense]
MAVDPADGSSEPTFRVPKMAEMISNHLRRQIVRGELVEGEVLPSEQELQSRFNVSRPTLREAFRILESESLISVQRGARGGARVRVPDTDVAARYAAVILEHRGTTLDDLYEARIVIEPAAVGLLAAKRTDDDLARLRAALVEHDTLVGDPRRSIRTHTAFHTLLIELTGNQTLCVLTGMIEHIISLANWKHVDSDLGSPEHATASRRGLKAHHRVVDLIESGGVAGATELWRKHLTEARDYLLRADVKTVLDLMG